MIEHLETVHEEDNKGWNKRNLAPTNSSDGKIWLKPFLQAVTKPLLYDALRQILHFENTIMILSGFKSWTTLVIVFKLFWIRNSKIRILIVT